MSDQHPEVASFRRQNSRHSSRVANARRDLAFHYRDLAERTASLQEALDEIRPPYHRYQISRRMEVGSLVALGTAEVVVAGTVVQALELTPTATDLAAVGVGGAATGLVWLVGHEWATSRDPQVGGRLGLVTDHVQSAGAGRITLAVALLVVAVLAAMKSAVRRLIALLFELLRAVVAITPVQALVGFSLVLAATDDMAEQALLAHRAYAAGVPLVACALYKKAAAGEVLSVPAAGTACWRCAVGAGTPSDSYRPGRDYGLRGRLIGESALGPSIRLVASVAASVALGLLAGPTSPAGRHVKQLLGQRRTLGLIATTPTWDFFKNVFAGMGHQHAPQSVWVRGDTSADCPVCGTRPVPPPDTQAGSDIVQIISERRQSIDNTASPGGTPADAPTDPGVQSAFDSEA